MDGPELSAMGCDKSQIKPSVGEKSIVETDKGDTLRLVRDVVASTVGW